MIDWLTDWLIDLLFLSIISTAYHLLSGSRAARLLLNWLIVVGNFERHTATECVPVLHFTRFRAREKLKDGKIQSDVDSMHGQWCTHNAWLSVDRRCWLSLCISNEMSNVSGTLAAVANSNTVSRLRCSVSSAQRLRSSRLKSTGRKYSLVFTGVTTVPTDSALPEAKSQGNHFRWRWKKTAAALSIS